MLVLKSQTPITIVDLLAETKKVKIWNSKQYVICSLTFTCYFSKKIIENKLKTLTVTSVWLR